MSKYQFGNQLKAVISKTQIKNALIARYVKYDISYISKWMSGKNIPSERHIEHIVSDISKCVVNNTDESEKNRLYKLLMAEESQDLKEVIEDSLLNAYYSDSEGSSVSREAEGGAYSVDDLLIHSIQKIKYIDILNQCHTQSDQRTDTIIITDLFNLDHESRLLLSGIQDGGFVIRNTQKNMHLSMVIHSGSLSGNIYDSISLIHMLTSYSNIDFNLYVNNTAKGKLLYVCDNRDLLTAFLAEGAHCLSAVYRPIESEAHQMYKQLKLYCNHDNLAFMSYSISEMLKRKKYLQGFISSKIDMITGHITEHFLPDEMFESFTEKGVTEGCISSQEAETIKQSRMLQEGLMGVTPFRLLMYKSALTKLMLTGEVDFFNRKYVLDNKQKIQLLEHLCLWIEQKKMDVKLIDGNLSSDFRNVSDPCLYMSDSTGYLRLENGRYEDNLLVIKNNEIKNMLLKFFDNVWDMNDSLIVEDEQQITDIIQKCIRQIKSIAERKQCE